MPRRALLIKLLRYKQWSSRLAFDAVMTARTPTIAELRERAQAIEHWYLDHVATWSDADLDRVVVFEFVGGGEGRMTKEDIILHIVNHTTYHRGFVGDMLKQIPHEWRANDYPVFLREEG